MDFGRLLADPIMEHAVVEKKLMVDFLIVLKTRRRYVNSGRLLADHILQNTGNLAMFDFVKRFQK